MLCPVTSYRRHDSFLSKESAPHRDYETRVESSDNSLIEMKRGIGQAPRKLVNANQRERNNNLNIGPKKDKITKNIINAPNNTNE